MLLVIDASIAMCRMTLCILQGIEKRHIYIRCEMDAQTPLYGRDEEKGLMFLGDSTI